MLVLSRRDEGDGPLDQACKIGESYRAGSGSDFSSAEDQRLKEKASRVLRPTPAKLRSECHELARLIHQDALIPAFNQGFFIDDQQNRRDVDIVVQYNHVFNKVPPSLTSVLAYNGGELSHDGSGVKYRDVFHTKLICEFVYPHFEVLQQIGLSLHDPSKDAETKKRIDTIGKNLEKQVCENNSEAQDEREAVLHLLEGAWRYTPNRDRDDRIFEINRTYILLSPTIESIFSMALVPTILQNLEGIIRRNNTLEFRREAETGYMHWSNEDSFEGRCTLNLKANGSIYLRRKVDDRA